MLPGVMISSVGASPLDSLLKPTTETVTVTGTTAVTSLQSTVTTRMVSRMKTAILKKIAKLSTADQTAWLKKKQILANKLIEKISYETTIEKLKIFVKACDALIAENLAKADAVSVVNAPTTDTKIVIGDNYVPTYPKYTYSGSGFEIPAGQSEILRRVKEGTNDSLTNNVQNILDNLLIGEMNFRQLQSVKLSSISVFEDRDYGYNVTVSIPEGTLSFFAQNDKWPDVCRNSTDTECYVKNQVKESEILSDDVAVRIAKDFVAKYSINVTQFGTPSVNHDWKVYYAMATDRTKFAFPTTVSVFYPLIVNGKNVYDEGGNLVGMNIDVDNKTKLVNNMYGLEYATWVKEYQAPLANSGAAAKIALQGGRYANDVTTLPANSVFKDVKLGTPTLAYVKMYDDSKTAVLYPYNEVLVPAYIFPTLNVENINKEGTLYVPKNIIVPLAKAFAEVATANATPYDAISSIKR